MKESLQGYRILENGDWSKSNFDSKEETCKKIFKNQNIENLNDNYRKMTIALVGFCTLIPTVTASNTTGHDIFNKFKIEYNKDGADNLKEINEFKTTISHFCSTNIDLKKEDIIKEILSFRQLNNNWDGYGAYPLEIESSFNALKFINYLDIEYLFKISSIYPNPNGTISFEWVNNMDEVIGLEIGNKTMSYYVDFASLNPIFENGKTITKESISKIQKYLSQLL